MTAFERCWRGMKADLKLHLLSIFSASVAFICLTSALLVVVNLEMLHQRWTESGRMSVFLKSGVSQDRVVEIERALRATQGVERVRFVSSEESRHDLVSEGSDDIVAALPKEAFPASLELALAEVAASGLIESLQTSLQRLPEVEAIETYQGWTQRLRSLLSGGLAAALVLAAIVLAAVVSVVASTIRLSLQRRRIEVDVLKVVGATDRYVRGPFVLEGAMQGAGGALLAVIVTGLLFLVMRSHLSAEVVALLGAAPGFLPWHWVVGLLSSGALVGGTAAQLSLRRLLLA